MAAVGAMPGEELSDYHWFLEALERVNGATRGTIDLDRMVCDVLDTALKSFECDRAALLCPGDAEASSWSILVERNATGTRLRALLDAVDGDRAKALRVVRYAAQPMELGPSVLAVAVLPTLRPAHVLALARVTRSGWLRREHALLREVGRRLGDALSSAAMFQSMRESQRKLDEVERAAHVAYWENDLLTDRLTWSDETYRIMGLRPSLSPLSIADFRARIHPDDRQLQDDAFERAVAGDGRFDMEFRLVRPSGEVRTVHTVGELVRNAAGQPVRAFGIVQDITERKRAQRVLSEKHSLLEAIIDGTSDAVFVKDRELRYLMMNAAGARLLGKPVDEVIGRDDPTLFSDIAFDVMAVDRGVIESGVSLTQEETATAAGEQRNYIVTKSVFRDAHGNPIGLIGIAKDVTELKRLEDDFRQAQKMEAVGRLAGGVAHDFNNLLMVINNCTEMVLESLDADQPNRSLLGEVLRAGERAAGLVRQLLALSRKQPLEARVVDLNVLLGDMHSLLRRVIGAHVELSLVQDESLALTKVDPGQFEQAMLNLVVNACDAMPEGGRLTITTRNIEAGSAEPNAEPAKRSLRPPPGPHVLVTVSDTGHGMNDATRRRVFEPFFTTKPAGRGTGLGLAMVYGFVKQSGGSIEIESGIGRGTTFEIYLPRTDEAPRSEPAPSIGPTGLASARETILLVEDEHAVRELCKQMLLSLGYQVLEATDGLDAMSVAAHHRGPIRMLLTDVLLPRMKGPQVAEQLKRLRPDLRVLFMSGHVGDDGLLESLSPLLNKPFSAAALAEKVREVLEDGPVAVHAQGALGSG
jgi:two-component system cell cycle sensor histidine kinase/response regulator CckA